MNELEKIQKVFLWKNYSPKTKHETLCNDYKGGGLKNIDILNKIISLQCSWIRRLYDNSFHEWKLIPIFLIKKSFGSPFKIHSNFFFKRNKIRFFHLSIRKSFYNGKNILPESLKFHLAFCLNICENIQVDKNSIYLVRFSEKNLIMFLNFFDQMAPLKRGMNLRLNTNCMKTLTFSGCNR